MIAGMTADTFAMQSVAELGVALADSGNFDIRLEAAIAKLYNSEAGWRVVDDTMQVRGGRGYETAESLEARGEAPIAVERALRSMRINRIFEGSSEIMRLFIAREAVDRHLQKAGAVADPDASLGAKAKDAIGLGFYMMRWIGGTLFGRGRMAYSRYGALAGHVAYADRASRRLARTLARAMVRFGPKLERRQAVLFRMVDIGAEIFAMCATVAFASKKLRENPADRSPEKLAGLVCRRARRKIEGLFDQMFSSVDQPAYALAQEVLAGEYRWLEQGILPPPAPEGIER
jgi:alkylation response protein AidB-like acyl-CoA dehydrogenase